MQFFSIKKPQLLGLSFLRESGCCPHTVGHCVPHGNHFSTFIFVAGHDSPFTRTTHPSVRPALGFWHNYEPLWRWRGTIPRPTCFQPISMIGMTKIMYYYNRKMSKDCFDYQSILLTLTNFIVQLQYFFNQSQTIPSTIHHHLKASSWYLSLPF
jgi:hypothetical protein